MSYSDWAPFNKENISRAPVKAGVYFLGSEHETTYIGASNNIKERLSEHLNSSDICIKETVSFCYHETLFPEAEEEKQLTAFQYEHGRLPKCNKSK
ncbi:MAG TPA: GIY-YIG nuclease family protein [Candidatus Nitrosotalea sp.]|nr:GIY-YIG nuclease family protein [Candidatus Nitrosotalea sp.]